ncbi:MAG: DUF1801 domain-containing protein [Spirosomataceae bacterium]
MRTHKPENIDSYIADFPQDIQILLEQMRATIRQAAPEAEEGISYGMPVFRLKGNLVYFAAFKKHIGFYALPTGNEAFREELSAYKTGKGSVQFPIDRPLPLALIAKMVKFRIEENLAKAIVSK